MHIWDPTTATPLGPKLAHREKIRNAAFSPNGQAVLVVTRGWAYLHSIADPQHPTLEASNLLTGPSTGVIRFLSDDGTRVQIVNFESANSVRLETLDFSKDTEPILREEPGELLNSWQRRPGLRFDKRGRVSPDIYD